MEQNLPEQCRERSGDTTHLLLLCSDSDTGLVLPGRDQRDAQVQQRGDAAQERGHESPGHTDADADEVVQSSEELLHRRDCSVPAAGD